mgnify:CR=1 FL=1
MNFVSFIIPAVNKKTVRLFEEKDFYQTAESLLEIFRLYQEKVKGNQPTTVKEENQFEKCQKNRRN